MNISGFGRDRQNEGLGVRKPKTSRRLILVAGALVLLLIAGTWEVLSPNSLFNQSTAIKAAIAWSCLPPLPQEAGDVRVKTSGSMFTRTVVLSFSCEASVVDHWLSGSLAIKGVVPETDSTGWHHYELKPCDGAAAARLSLSTDKTRVQIKASWS